MSIYDRGSAILIEVQFQKRTAHVNSPAFYDPTSARISIYDPSSTVVASTLVLSASNASSTGLFERIIQSSESWTQGQYETKITALDGTFGDVTIEPRTFELE